MFEFLTGIILILGCGFLDHRKRKAAGISFFIGGCMFVYIFLGMCYDMPGLSPMGKTTTITLEQN